MIGSVYKIKILVLISFLLSSCIKNESKSEIIATEKFERTIAKLETDTIEFAGITTLEKTDSISKSVISNAPCIELKEFVIEIEKLNWVSDTNRLKKVAKYGELDRKKIKYFNERPFYPINFEKSRLQDGLKRFITKSNFDSIDVKLFKEVNNIWAYFYRDKESSDLISDGVIEQWEFDTEKQADAALRFFEQIRFYAYTNTTPYSCRIRNKLIIFQTRASVFSLEQKTIFEKFVKDNRPRTFHR